MATAEFERRQQNPVPNRYPDRIARGTPDRLDLILDEGGVYPAQAFLPDDRRICIAVWFLDEEPE